MKYILTFEAYGNGTNVYNTGVNQNPTTHTQIKIVNTPEQDFLPKQLDNQEEEKSIWTNKVLDWIKNNNIHLDLDKKTISYILWEIRAPQSDYIINLVLSELD